MRVKFTATICAAVAMSVYASVSQSNPDAGAGNRWAPEQPGNMYWQTPNWSGFNRPPAYNSPPPSARPMYNNANQAPPVYRQPPRANNYPAPYANQPYMGRPAPDAYRGYPPPPPRGPYYGPDSGASAFNTPGYNRYRNNGWNNNKFWGRSGPSTWMNPNKRNMERGWDDMINAPSRMGEMPGGWTAPEVSMPNPIDVGDQMQDNVKDLPEQMRDMDVGNN